MQWKTIEEKNTDMSDQMPGQYRIDQILREGRLVRTNRTVDIIGAFS